MMLEAFNDKILLYNVLLGRVVAVWVDVPLNLTAQVFPFVALEIDQR